MTTITLKGLEIPLLYTVLEMKTIQEELCPLGELSYRIMGANPENPEDRNGFGDAKHLDAVAKLVKILGNAGLEEAGEAADLTERRVLRAMKPGQISEIVTACANAISEGMETEIPEPGADEPKDVVLEELNKKKEAGS